jgi:hypothetical protein
VAADPESVGVRVGGMLRLVQMRCRVWGVTMARDNIYIVSSRLRCLEGIATLRLVAVNTNLRPGKANQGMVYKYLANLRS